MIQNFKYLKIVALLLLFCLCLFVCDDYPDYENDDDISSTEPGYYIASSKSDVFHRPSCRYVSSIKSENKITFSTRQQAINAGYRACSVCKP